MTTKKTLLISIIVAFAIGCITGLATGGYQGYRTGIALILNSALERDAREVGTRIEILNDIRTDQYAPAIEKLESGLDDTLIMFDPDEPYPGLDERTVSALAMAIDKARLYREEHPWPENQQHGKAAMVRHLFANNPYQQ